jgi:hypothetical protein
MRITGPPDIRLAALQRLTLAALPRTAAATLEPVAPPAAVPAPTPAQVQTQASVALLVAIAATDPEARRRRNTTSADNGLKALESLHEELRIGPPSPARLRAIAAWMDNHGVPDEPAAADLLREVELRVLVELAKAERDG